MSRKVAVKLRALRIEKIPQTPGVYFFVGKNKKPLYIGKAANLRTRLKYYFQGARPEKVLRLLEESSTLILHPLESEIQAVLEEARLIKLAQPKFNVLLRDDKNYFYVGITKEKFPRIFITHQPKQAAGAEYIGTFVNGRTLHKVLKMVRTYFPYCTCPKPHARICLQHQLDLCPGYCCRIGAAPSQENTKHYQETIRRVKQILMGAINPLKKDLRKKIEQSSHKQQFERASEYRHEFEGLESIARHRGFIESFIISSPDGKKETASESFMQLAGLDQTPEKIEMYDISMIFGTNAVGAMVVFIDGQPDKTQWRLFRIRQTKTLNDPAMMAETIIRRLRHPEWSYPDALIVDGGIGQLGAAREALANSKNSEAREIPVFSIAKGPSRKNDRLLWYSPDGKLQKKSFKNMPPAARHLLTVVRDEAHRYVLSYHRKRRQMQIIS